MTNNQRVTALSLACQFGRCAVVQALLQRLSREAKMVKGELRIKIEANLSDNAFTLSLKIPGLSFKSLFLFSKQSTRATVRDSVALTLKQLPFP